ncbi:MAG: hypothetical protein IPI22_11250 [Bacteroidetes bacterium]|nr:hypothetical protein [Bacteroidota bacterium]
MELLHPKYCSTFNRYLYNKVTSPSGCTSVATISVTINPAVTVSASFSYFYL